MEDSLGSVVLRTTLPTGCNHGLRFRSNREQPTLVCCATRTRDPVRGALALGGDPSCASCVPGHYVASRFRKALRIACYACKEGPFGTCVLTLKHGSSPPIVARVDERSTNRSKPKEGLWPPYNFSTLRVWVPLENSRVCGKEKAAHGCWSTMCGVAREGVVPTGPPQTWAGGSYWVAYPYST